MMQVAIPSEQLLETLFDNIHMPIAYMDTDFNFIRVNNAYAAADERGPDHFIGKNHFDLFPNKENEQIFRDVVKNGKPHHVKAKAFEYKKNPERGVTHWDWTLAPVKNAKGKVAGVLLQLLDVTEHIEAEIALQEKHQLVSNIMQEAGDLIIVLDREGKITMFNKAAEKLTGYDYDEVQGRFVWDFLLVPEEIEPVQEVFKQITLNIPNEYENYWVSKAGKKHLLYWKNTFLNNSNDEVEFIVSVGTDITKRKQAELLLQQQSKIIDQIHDSVVSTDLNGNVTSWNKGAEKIFGFTRAEMLGRHISGVYPEDEHEFLQNEIIAPLLAKGVHESEVKMMRKSGDFFYAHLSLSLEFDETNQVCGMIGYTMDITERKLVEQELEYYQQNLEAQVEKRTAELIKAKEDAEHANLLKSRFLSRMSHELRTPMNAIIGFTQLLRLDCKSEKEQEFISEVLVAADHLLALINEVLDLSRIESGNLLLHMKPTSLYQLCKESVSVVKKLASETEITLCNNISPEEDVTLYTDAVRLKEVIVNLLSNAIKYNKKKGSVTLSHVVSANGFVRVVVTDTGKGIAIADQEDIFEPFNRLGAEFTDVEGSGIGLTISKQLINLLGGNIGVESQLNIGSSFWFECPVSTEKMLSNKSNREIKAVSVEKNTSRILYVEDNPANLRLMQNIIASQDNIELLSAVTAEAGLKIAEENELDLVLLDINLPGIDGYEALERFKLINNPGKFKILALSASASPREIERGLLAGFQRYLTKPINVEEFVDILKHELAIN